jgi:hypothetical protein
MRAEISCLVVRCNCNLSFQFGQNIKFPCLKYYLAVQFFEVQFDCCLGFFGYDSWDISYVLWFCELRFDDRCGTVTKILSFDGHVFYVFANIILLISNRILFWKSKLRDEKDERS